MSCGRTVLCVHDLASCEGVADSPTERNTVGEGGVR
jgi:hypothetical protein